MATDFHMTVFKPKGRRYYVAQWVDPIRGKKKTRSTGCERKRPAERFAGQLEKELREGTYRDRSRITWAEFRRRYEDEALSGQARESSVKAAGVFNLFERLIGPKYLAVVDSALVSRFASKLREEGRAESTTKGYLAYLKAALRWGARQGMLARAPHFDMPKRTDGMHGRPLTTEEFERMLAKSPEALAGLKPGDSEQAAARKREWIQALSPATVDSWRFLLRGLFWSGLRLSEALRLHWQDDRLMSVDLSGKRPMFVIQPEGQKSHKAQLLPIAPEFAEMLLSVPEDDRQGFVFNPAPVSRRDGRLKGQQTSRMISRIGERAGVKVADRGESVKYASAHDLRRAFGFRWAQRVMPNVLQQLMRHESIETTLKYYVGRNAESAADALWDAVAGTDSGASVQPPANTSANTGPAPTKNGAAGEPAECPEVPEK